MRTQKEFKKEWVEFIAARNKPMPWYEWVVFSAMVLCLIGIFAIGMMV